MRIIGFSGKKQSGKTTAVQDLKQRLEAQGKTVAIVSFADALKDAVEHLFAVPIGIIPDWDSDEFKNTVHPCGKTYRQLLQIFGTDFCRALWPDIWVEVWKWQVLNIYPNYDYILVPDVRFENEVKVIQDLGGKVIRLTRAPFASQDKHESETALDKIQFEMMHPFFDLENRSELKFDAVLDNSQMSIPEQNEAVWKIITGWWGK